MNNTYITILAITAVTFLTGNAYAIKIALRPFPDHLTWLSVVVGDAFTDLAMSALIWTYTGSVWLALIPWCTHALTGGPMIVGQIIKYRFFQQEVEKRNNQEEE